MAWLTGGVPSSYWTAFWRRYHDSHETWLTAPPPPASGSISENASADIHSAPSPMGP